MRASRLPSQPRIVLNLLVFPSLGKKDFTASVGSGKAGTERGKHSGKICSNRRTIHREGTAEKRDLTTEEQTNYKKYFDDAAELKVKIVTAPRQCEIDRELAAMG